MINYGAWIQAMMDILTNPWLLPIWLPLFAVWIGILFADSDKKYADEVLDWEVE